MQFSLVGSRFRLDFFFVVLFCRLEVVPRPCHKVPLSNSSHLFIFGQQGALLFLASLKGQTDSLTATQKGTMQEWQPLHHPPRACPHSERVLQGLSTLGME